MILTNGHLQADPVTAGLMSVLHGEAHVAAMQSRIDAQNEAFDAVDPAERQAFIAAAFNEGNADNRAVIAASAVKKINISLWADNTALALFEQISLAANEIPEIVTITDQGYNALQVNGHGYAPRQQYLNGNTAEYLKTYTVGTGIVKFPKISGLTGPLNLLEDQMRNVGRTMDQKVNTDIYALIDASYGAYPAGTLVPDPRIKSGTLPTTSSINLFAEAAYTYEVYKTAVDHFLRLGKQLKLIVMNPQEWRDSWDWQTVVSSTSSGSQDATTLITVRIKENIDLEGSAPSRLLGQNVTYLLDPTREAGRAEFYAGPAGTIYDKPSLAETVIYDARMMANLGHGKRNEGIEMDIEILPIILADQYRNKLLIDYTT